MSFTYNPANVNAIMSTTLANYHNGGELVDNIFTGIPTLKFLLEKKRYEEQVGGETIVIGLMYGKNTTSQFQSETEVVDTTLQEGLTNGNYAWKTATATVGITTADKLKNRGEYQLVNLVKTRTDQAMLSLKDTFATAIFAASPGSNDIESLATLVDSSGTVGNINGSVYSWWQATETASGSFAAQGISDMRTLYNTISKSGADTPDFAVTTQAIYEYYENTLMDQARYDILGNKAILQGGAEALKFKRLDLTFDENCNSGVLYMINTKYLNFVGMQGANFTPGPFIQPENQIVATSIIHWMGNLCVSNRARQGKLTGITA